jgi:hypothetical protein
MTDEERDLRWVLEVIGQQQDGAWGNFARMALNGTMKIAETRARWSAAAREPGWLDQRGVIVLGETRDLQHVSVSLATNDEAQAWLDDISAAQREAARRAVTSELAMAGSRIKKLLLLARKGVSLTGQTNG